MVPSVDLDELVSGTLAYIESCSDLESVISEWMKWDTLKHKCETMSYVALRKLRAMGISVPRNSKDEDLSESVIEIEIEIGC